MLPMTAYPCITPMWWFCPVSANEGIRATSWFPFFIYPHVAWRWCYGTLIARALRPDLYIDLCAAAVCSTAQCYDKYKQEPFDVLHDLKFYGYVELDKIIVPWFNIHHINCSIKYFFIVNRLHFN
jgi:hypothetical protein